MGWPSCRHELRQREGAALPRTDPGASGQGLASGRAVPTQALGGQCLPFWVSPVSPCLWEFIGEDKGSRTFRSEASLAPTCLLNQIQMFHPDFCDPSIVWHEQGDHRGLYTP